MSDPSPAPSTTLWGWRVGAALSVVVVGAMLVTTGDAIEVEVDEPPTGATVTATSTTSPATVPVDHVPPPGAVPPTSTLPAPIAPPTRGRPSTIDLESDYEPIEVDEDAPAVANRDIPDQPADDEPPPSTVAPPRWASSTRVTDGGQVSVDVGCADDAGVAALDWFFAGRVGPVIGWDYQHVYPLGGDRYLWLFQDAFVDHSGTAGRLDQARFVHNAALVQDGSCFRLLHRGTPEKPQPFETGDGSSRTRVRWWWPMGGELVDGQVWVFWAEMVKDPYDPDPPDGLGWHPEHTWLASYDATTLERTSFTRAANSGVTPIYGYAVGSDASHTYLFGNTFEQNLLREGGFWNPDHSATAMWLARVPRGQLTAAPEYRTTDGWSRDAAAAVPIVDRFHVENPMQPRLVDGQWVSATAVDGYWGNEIAIDVAPDPWGPWSTVAYQPLRPRNGDPAMNAYHAHVLPWRDGFGSVLVSVSNNARDMRNDAWPYPHRYRPTFLHFPYAPTPVPPAPTTTTTATTAPTTSTSTTRPTTTTSTTTTSTTTSTTTTTTSTTTTTTSTTSTTTTTVPASSTSSTPSTAPPPTSAAPTSSVAAGAER